MFACSRSNVLYRAEQVYADASNSSVLARRNHPAPLQRTTRATPHLHALATRAGFQAAHDKSAQAKDGLFLLPRRYKSIQGYAHLVHAAKKA